MLIRDLFENHPPDLDGYQLQKIASDVALDGELVRAHWNLANKRDAYEDGPMEGPEFDDWLIRYVDERFGETWANIDHHMVDGKLPIYRVITAPPDWEPDPNRHPGIYWSWDKRAADAHCGDYKPGHVKWMMEAIAGIDDIDWEETYFLNIGDLGDDEREIRLKAGVPIKVENFYRHR